MTSSFCSRAASRVYLDVLVLRSRAWTDFSLIVAHDVPRRYTRKLSVVRISVTAGVTYTWPDTQSRLVYSHGCSGRVPSYCALAGG